MSKFSWIEFDRVRSNFPIDIRVSRWKQVLFNTPSQGFDGLHRYKLNAKGGKVLDNRRKR